MNNQLIQNNLNQIPKIRVIVRKRPLNKKEQDKNETDIIEIKDKKTLTVKEIKTTLDLTKIIEPHNFTFDIAYDENSTNENIYLETVRPMIQCAFLQKAKITCFAYGQTGSGKTFTMMGNTINSIYSPGLYLLAAYDIFQILNYPQFNKFTLNISFYEIYCNKIFDLLNNRNILPVREDGKQNINIIGLTEKKVNNFDSLMNIIQYGLKIRTVGITGANNDSSRSHGIIQISIINNLNKLHGKITFIDLAGSERESDKIDVDKQTRIDGAEINKSLLALKECIRALDQEKSHLPFRQSKLTLVLRDSFIGNCKTLMIANVSPSSDSADHTLNTLRYADRVKELKTKGNSHSNGRNVIKKNDNLNSNKSNINNNNNFGKKKINTQELIGNLLKGNSSENNILSSKQNYGNNYNNNYNNNVKNAVTKTVNKSFYVPSNKENFNLSSENNFNVNMTQIQNNMNNENNLDNNFENLNTCPNLSLQHKMTLTPNSINLINLNFQNNNDSNHNSNNNYNNDNNNNNNNIEYNQNEEKLKTLQDKHEKVLQELLSIEDLCVDKYMNNLIEIGQSLNQELEFIQQYKKGEMNIKDYAKTMKKLIQSKIIKLQSIVMNFDKFSVKVEEENQLSNNIEKLKEIIDDDSQKTFSIYSQQGFDFNNFNQFSIDNSDNGNMDLDGRNFN